MSTGAQGEVALARRGTREKLVKIADGVDGAGQSLANLQRTSQALAVVGQLVRSERGPSGRRESLADAEERVAMTLALAESAAERDVEQGVAGYLARLTTGGHSIPRMEGRLSPALGPDGAAAGGTCSVTVLGKTGVFLIILPRNRVPPSWGTEETCILTFRGTWQTLGEEGGGEETPTDGRQEWPRLEGALVECCNCRDPPVLNRAALMEEEARLARARFVVHVGALPDRLGQNVSARAFVALVHLALAHTATAPPYGF